MTDTDTSPLVLHGRRRSAARLRAGAVLLETGGVRRRIPVAAIERVDVRRPRGRELAVVLTSRAADPVTYSLVARSAPAVREFAEAVRRALPVRDADEPRTDGAGLVSEERIGRWDPHPLLWLWSAVAAAYAGVFVALLVVGAGEDPTVSWLLSPLMYVNGWLAARAGWRRVRETWALRTRGITVEGRLKRSFVDETDDDHVMRYVYAFVDARGVSRERTGPEGGAGEVEIVYDPAAPEVTKVGRGTVGRMAAGGALALFLGLPMLALGGVMAAKGVLVLVA